MTSRPDVDDLLRQLAARSAAEGGVFWHEPTVLAVFAPDPARRISAANWRRLAVPDRLVHVLRRRHSTPVRWQQVRGAWLTQLRRLSTPDSRAALTQRMHELLAAEHADEIDLVLLAQHLMIRSMLPVAVAGLSPREFELIFDDVYQKAIRVVAMRSFDGFGDGLRLIIAELRAGTVMRRVLRQRASGRRPRQLDLTDPVVDLRAELGADRALDAATTVLTALGGPPGTVAAGLLYELASRPDWAERLTAELAGVAPESFHRQPAEAAPLTHRFVLEVLRMWSVPVLFRRPAMQDLELDGVRLARGEHFLLSPHLIHRNPQLWQRPDDFDPDRFLPDSPHRPAEPGGYVPFGWPPTQCVGADIATFQLMALCMLVCTRFRVVAKELAAVTVVRGFAAVPQGFRGTVRIRTTA